ncbi:MAG: tetratricopeptide repeat protein [Lachnospiraceae bacterium]|nr:tetratricopeptide repeat protein [Lachnospiraceae bacterium]
MASIYERECRQISNRFYNIALDRAINRDLYGATILLKKSLSFYNRNINARNLLGLIFYEEGSIVEAIVQWLISKDLYKNEINPANEYLSKVQNDDDTEKLLKSVKMYNSAIDDINPEQKTYVEQNRKDNAMLKLYKAVEYNDHNVKALLLLSVILLSIGNHIKAGAYLIKCQKIDNGNKFINEHMDYVLKNTKKSEVKEKKIENIYSIKKLENDDAILPRKYIKLSENQKVIFVLIGIIIGVLFHSLIISPKTNSSKSFANQEELIRYAELVNDQNKKIRDITIENNELKTQYEDASVKLRAYEEQNRMFTSQYEMLNSIISDFDNGYISRAAKNYVELDKDSITEESLVTLLNQARSRIEGIGAKRLSELGTESWNGGNKNAAISYYQLSLSINPADAETMFLLARLYQNLDRLKEANELFDKIIAQHPDSNYARRSREARGY